MCHSCRCLAKKDSKDKSGVSTARKRKKKSALEILALAASLVNPREFELPRELRLPITFPGTDKVDPASGKRGRQPAAACNNGERRYTNRKIDAIFLFFCLNRKLLKFFVLFDVEFS